VRRPRVLRVTSDGPQYDIAKLVRRMKGKLSIKAAYDEYKNKYKEGQVSLVLKYTAPSAIKLT
jgi:hypothetical protein